MGRSFKRFLIVALALGAVTYWYSKGSHQEYVNVYNWYAMIPKDVMDEFTQETGIRIRLDFYDNNEVLEAKLFAGSSGYDIVFPSASPYLARQIKAGIFMPLSKELIPNAQDLERLLMEQMETVDPGNLYAIPYYWGTLGFAYNVESIKKRIPSAPIDSFQMLFDPEILEKLEGCGVTMLEEAVDVYPLMLIYMGKDLKSASIEDLWQAQENLLKIRPYIRRFSSSRLVGELVSGETCLAQAWSGDTQIAIREAAQLGRTIRYVIPKEGTTLWVDAMAIPKDAPHPFNAHKFINFLLRPDIAARVSLYTLLATATKSSKTYLPEDFKNDKNVFPPLEIMEKLELDQDQDITYERERNRMWTNFRLHRKDH